MSIDYTISPVLVIGVALALIVAPAVAAAVIGWARRRSGGR